MPAPAVQAEVDAFISEIESTGTAFEQMRERNQVLLDQLTARDEANASVTSERLRVTPFCHLLRRCPPEHRTLLSAQCCLRMLVRALNLGACEVALTTDRAR